MRHEAPMTAERALGALQIFKGCREAIEERVRDGGVDDGDYTLLVPSAPSPSHHHFDRWYAYHSQSWLVYHWLKTTLSDFNGIIHSMNGSNWLSIVTGRLSTINMVIMI